MTPDQWVTVTIAAAITAAPWVLFVIAKMTMKDDTVDNN